MYCFVCRNYTLRKMPVPVYDASVALRSEPQKTEQALQTVSSCSTSNLQDIVM